MKCLLYFRQKLNKPRFLKMTKVSIIIPIYNLEGYLSKCLDCLICQTLKDIEIICVNDESTDNSLAVLKDYAKKDKRIKIINQKNAGPGVARNAGIDAAKGEYIQFVDGDDWIEPDTCEKCYQKAKQSGVDMLTFNALFISPTKQMPYIYYNLNEEKIISYKDISDILFQSHFNVWHYLFKKSFLEENHIRFPKIVLGEDVPFVLKAWLTATKVYCIPETLYNYNDFRTTSICRSYRNKTDIFTFLEMSRDLILPIQSKNLNESFARFKLAKLFYEYRKEPDKIEQKKFKELAKKFCTSSEYKKFLRRIRQPITASYKLKLFNFIPVFSYKERGTTKRCKIFGLPILKIKKRGQTTTRYILCGLPIFKSIKGK